MKQKRFFSSHSKSSAAVISIALHLVLLLIAGTFVAVQVVVKGEKKFVAKQVDRPKMPPRKLQVPVKIKKQRRKPRLKQRIVVKNTIRNMPEIKMPEISGIKGGLGAGVGAGLGDAASIGFNMPEIEVFGVRSKGEKVLLALDTDAYIMRDEVGGKRAYAIIKEELVNVVKGLGPATLFNLVVFDHGKAVALFPRMVPATRENAARAKEWLDPLNKVTKKNIGTTGTYGLKTLGKGGVQIDLTDAMKGGLEEYGARHWFRPVSHAMVNQADTVFILSGWWGVLRRADGPYPEWPASKKQKWDEYVRKARGDLKEENRKRAAKGEPERILRDDWTLISAYYPKERDRYWRGDPPYYYYTWKDFKEALEQIRKEHAPKLPGKSGISREKDWFSLNVIFFDEKDKPGPVGQFEMLAKRCNGDFRIIKGLEAIESSASSSKD